MFSEVEQEAAEAITVILVRIVFQAGNLVTNPCNWRLDFPEYGFTVKPIYSKATVIMRNPTK
jgi:hypothetical protein